MRGHGPSRRFARHARWLSSPGACLLLLALAGCAGSPPAFRSGRPDAIAPGAPSIAVIGDLQMTPAFVRRMRGREDNREAQRRLVDDLTRRTERLGALVIVGDLVFTARSQRAWSHFDDLVAPFAASMPVLPAIGNHDYYCVFVQLCMQRVVPGQFRRRFPWMEPGMPYLVRYGRLVLVFLDSETALEPQAGWLADTLAAEAGRADLALVFFHRPPYSNSIDRGARGDVDVERLLVPVLQSSPLRAAVFNGHVHGFEHLLVDDIHYFTTAGGGGPRGRLGAERPGDIYAGPDCDEGPGGDVLRPFNYVLVTPDNDGVTVDVRGFCRGDSAVRLLESVRLDYGRSSDSR